MIALVDLDRCRRDRAIAQAGGELRLSKIDGVATPFAPTEFDGDFRDRSQCDMQARLASANRVPGFRCLIEGQHHSFRRHGFAGGGRLNSDGNLRPRPVHQ